jgi:hypothetical protein
LQLGVVREEESLGGGVIKLVAIITLDRPDSAAKLCGQVSEEVREWGMWWTYNAKGRSTSSECNHRGYQVILVARNT